MSDQKDMFSENRASDENQDKKINVRKSKAVKSKNHTNKVTKRIPAGNKKDDSIVKEKKEDIFKSKIGPKTSNPIPEFKDGEKTKEEITVEKKDMPAEFAESQSEKDTNYESLEEGLNPLNPSIDKENQTTKEDRFLFITHRRNLLSVMSSGLIGPEQVYGKYREDILVKTKGLVSLFNANISNELIELTTSNKESNFPVVLEFDKDKLPKSFLYGINAVGEVVDNVSKEDSMLLRVTSEILSTNMIKEVHFLNEENLNDFKNRMFDNVPIEDFNLSESPKIFESKKPFPVEYFDNIKGQDSVNITRLARISDKVAASISLLAENMQRASDLKLLHSLLSFPYQGNKSRMLEEYDVLAQVISSLVGLASNQKDFNNDYFLLHATLEELIDIDVNDGWVALDFLNNVENKFKSLSNNNELDKYFDASRKIINSEMEIPEHIFSDEQNTIQRAILLFILRPDYEDLINKENSQLNPGKIVKKIAILITGFRIGYERISSKYKVHHHHIFAPLRAYIINFGLGKQSEKFERNPKAIVQWNSDERVYTFEWKLLKDTLSGELSIKSYIHSVIQKMLDQGHLAEDFEAIAGTLVYRFQYLKDEVERRQPVKLDFNSIEDNLIISSPCFEITSPSHQKRITKKILEKVFTKDYNGRAYWVYEKNNSINLKRVIRHDEIEIIDIVELIKFIAKAADEVEEKFFKQDRVR